MFLSRKFCAAIALAGIALAAAPITPAQASITYNADLAPPGVYFGTGNSNGRFTINTVNGVELGLRGKVPYEGGPVPVGNVYSFDLGKTIGIDYSFNPVAGGSPFLLDGQLPYRQVSMLTITNLGTGNSASFDPFLIPDNDTNAGAPGGIQNSERLSFGFLNGGAGLGDIGYDSSLNATYRATWTISASNIATMSDTIILQQGTGAAVPEPATGAIMILGMMGIIGLGRRRRGSQKDARV